MQIQYYPVYQTKILNRQNLYGVVVISFALLTGCSDSKETDSADDSSKVEANPEWNIVTIEDEQGAWLRAHVPSDTPEQIWLVGGQPTQGAIKVGNALSGFEGMTLPSDTPLLNWADGTSTNMWVGGLNGTILHWDGSVWSDHSLGIEEAIWGLAVVDDTVVVVGGSSRWGGDAAILFTYENDLWTSVDLPMELSGIDNLFKVAYDGSQYWMVGTSGALIYGSLDNLQPIPTGITQDLITVIATESNAQIVGGRGTGIYTKGVNGTLEEPTQIIAGINGITANSDDLSLLVGELGYGTFLNSDSETWVEIPAATTHILHAAAVHEMDGKQYWYAVGGNLATADSTFDGSILTMEWTP